MRISLRSRYSPTNCRGEIEAFIDAGLGNANALLFVPLRAQMISAKFDAGDLHAGVSQHSEYSF